MNWQLVPHKDGGKPTKPPYQPDGRLAKTDVPSTWNTFSMVAEAAPRFDGIGFVLTKDDPYVGLDFDHCRCPAFDGLDDELGKQITSGLNMVLPEIAEHIRKINSYTENSPSGKGMRVFVTGALPVDGKRKGPIEIYQAGRYLTMTGHVVDGFPLTVEHRQQALDAFFQDVFGDTEEGEEKVQQAHTDTTTDGWRDLLIKAFQSQHGQQIRRLYEGDHSTYPSPSEADMALCSHLAFWFDGDAPAMDSAFRKSGLMRKKWDEKRGSQTYGEKTINKTIVSYKKTHNSTHARPSLRGSEYFIDPQGYWCRWKQTIHGTVSVRLSNFTAKIEEEILEDDGVETVHRYDITGQMGDTKLPSIDVPAALFAGMNWIAKWGAQAIIEPGQSIKDILRHAIQVTSPDINKSTRYTHTGWRDIDGRLTYLTAGGGIGTDNVSVKLSTEMSRYALPLKPENEEEAIRASLSFLDIGNREVTLPLLATTYLAPLTSLLNPTPNFSSYLYGSTGTLKSTLSILQLCHFGDFSTITNLPNFDDTANSLEKRAFTLKDVLMVVDDYHPSQRRSDAMNKEHVAQRIIRAYSNRTARGRLNSDTTDKGRYFPRGFLQVTGEEIISLPSSLARIFVVEIQPGDINIDKLTEIQKKAHLLPHAMSSFIGWLQHHMDDIRVGFVKRFGELRSQSSQNSFHRKLPEQISFLMFALETVISWLVDKNILCDDMARELAEEGWGIFTRISERHSQRIAEEDPIKLFEDIMDAMITQGKVRLEHRTALGQEIGGSQGALIGYYDERHVYMMPTLLWHELSHFCITEGTHFPFSKHTLYKMLWDRKLIEHGTGNAKTTTIKIQGKTVRVLKFVGGGLLRNTVPAVIEVTDD